MNRKGKNKKGKISNQSLTQTEKVSDKIEETVTTNKELTEKTPESIKNEEKNVEEERVPEIKKEGSSFNAKEEETPKKPKRNKGKKSIEKEDDVTINLESEPVKNDTLSTDINKSLDTQVQKDTEIVTPTVRKKKNKKQNDRQKENEEVLGNIEYQSSFEIRTSNIKASESLEATQESLVEQKHGEEKVAADTINQESVKQEIKPGKKKNKKKKKNDSEKPTMEEISCLSTSQSLSDEKKDLLDINKLNEEKSDIATVEQAELAMGNLSLEETTKTKAIIFFNELPCLKDETKGKINLVDHEMKTKGEKNKQKCEELVALSDKFSEIGLQPSEMETATKNISEQADFECLAESFPKTKAKIAKPVTKKHNENKLKLETQQGNIIHGVPIVTKSQDMSQNLESIEKVDNLAESVIVKGPQNDSSDIVKLSDTASQETIEKELGLLNVPEKTTSKKRKKGLKIPKDIEKLGSKIECIEQTTDTSQILFANDPLTTINLSSPTTTTISQVQTEDEFISSSELLKEKDEIKIIPSEANQLKLDHENEVKDKIAKNSPEIVQVTPINNDSTIMQTLDCKQKSLSSSLENSEKVDALKMKAPNVEFHDIETISLKPDVPERSNFETVDYFNLQSCDDNNNSAIKEEIFPVQQIINPLENLTEITKEDLTITQEEGNSEKKVDKTDLKSKMMEVNQDMEELRLSIERSLAELSFIEKQDDILEQQFEKLEENSEKQITELKIETKQDGDKQKKIIPVFNVDEASVSRSEELPCYERTSESSNMKNKELSSNKTNLKHCIQNVSEVDKIFSMDVDDKSDNKVVDTPLKDSKIVTSATDLKTPTTIAEKLTETLLKFDIKGYTKPVMKQEETKICDDYASSVLEIKDDATKANETENRSVTPPVCPSRKDNKSKHKKKKGKQDIPVVMAQSSQSAQSTTNVTVSSSTSSQENKQVNKNDHKKENKNENKGKGKQQASNLEPVHEDEHMPDGCYEPIENFEDALTSSVDDVNQSFEMIVKDSEQEATPPNILNDEKSPVTLPKNLLGHPDIPVRSNKRDYKKVKDKIPDEITAKVKIKDSVEIEKKLSKNTQTVNKLKDSKYYKVSETEEFVYKYNFRKVFLQNICHVCKKILNADRVACCYCNLVFYCGIKHKEEDWPQHEALCFAVSTIAHLRGQKHIYADAKNITGHDYRMIRMQMIVSCEKILKRRLVPWEQEALLYPRICAHVPCREWLQMRLSDCQGCGQISYCTENPDHYPKNHSRWCKSYSLYQKLVSYQQAKGRLEPKLPTKVMAEKYEIPEKINEILAEMYEEKIDMNDIQYAALTQLATAPLTAAYCHQLCKDKGRSANGYKKSTFTIHVVGAELQFEADALNKWEVFFLHLRPDIQELKVVLINRNLNPSNLPLSLLGKIRICENCRQKKRSVVFNFQERYYDDYKRSEDFEYPDIACAFNPSIQRSSIYNGKDPWPSTINVIIKERIPFLITAYTMIELQKDCTRIKESVDAEYNFISEPKSNNFASVRPDRNFISDDETPLLFKNCCFAIICG